MSLVDYASSEEDEPGIGEREEDNLKTPSIDVPENFLPSLPPPPPPPPSLPRNPLASSSNQIVESSLDQLELSMVKLPDASLLLNSPAVPSHLAHTSDHSSRVAAAMAESASRKREPNGLSSSYPRIKVPRGTLPHSRTLPDTAAGLLLPPQVSGRSNIVTEDLGKLFVKRNA